MLLIDAMIKINACQIHKQFMKDLEHNDFPVRKKRKRKDLNLSPKELGKALQKKSENCQRIFA